MHKQSPRLPRACAPTGIGGLLVQIVPGLLFVLRFLLRQGVGASTAFGAKPTAARFVQEELTLCALPGHCDQRWAQTLVR